MEEINTYEVLIQTDPDLVLMKVYTGIPIGGVIREVAKDGYRDEDIIEIRKML